MLLWHVGFLVKCRMTMTEMNIWRSHTKLYSYAPMQYAKRFLIHFAKLTNKMCRFLFSQFALTHVRWVTCLSSRRRMCSMGAKVYPLYSYIHAHIRRDKVMIEIMNRKSCLAGCVRFAKWWPWRWKWISIANYSIRHGDDDDDDDDDVLCMLTYM